MASAVPRTIAPFSKLSGAAAFSAMHTHTHTIQADLGAEHTFVQENIYEVK